MEEPKQQNDSVSESSYAELLFTMRYFFVSYTLEETKSKLWKLYKGWVHLSSECPNGDESKDMIFFYEQMVEFVNFCYKISEHRDSRESCTF